MSERKQTTLSANDGFTAKSKKKKKKVKGCTENANSSEQAANEDCAGASVSHLTLGGSVAEGCSRRSVLK